MFHEASVPMFETWKNGGIMKKRIVLLCSTLIVPMISATELQANEISNLHSEIISNDIYEIA